MKEVEVKAKINNVDSIRKNLNKIGVEFFKKTTQSDEVYIGNKTNLSKMSARIRLENNIYTLTVKEKLSNILDNNEYEFVTTKPKDTAKLLIALGFKRLIKVKKVRTLYKYKKLSICLDQVAGLGNYIEVEKIVNESVDSQVVQKEICKFLEKLGLTKNDQVIAAYFELILRKKI